jgi:hypothetical protein
MTTTALTSPPIASTSAAFIESLADGATARLDHGSFSFTAG